MSMIKRTENYRAKYTMRYNYLIISTIFLLLTIEWLLRRRMGLM